jgi:cytochrome c oxidase subunit 3
VTTVLLVLVAIMATVVWWLLRQTINVSPWIERRPVDDVPGDGALLLPPVKVGLGVFLAVATSLFALMISAYFMRMAGADWTTLAVPKGLWLNTSALVLSSVAMQWTRNAAKRGVIDRVRIGLIAAGVFAFCFLAGQLWVWQQLTRRVTTCPPIRPTPSFTCSPQCTACTCWEACGFGPRPPSKYRVAWKSARYA